MSLDSPTANTYWPLIYEIKFWLKREVPLLFKCRRLRLRCWSVVMLLWSIKLHSFWRQKFLKILLTSLTLLANSLSSGRAVRLEMATERPSWSTMRPMSTISSVHSREEFEFRRLLVPAWIIIESGFRLTIGLIWSAVSFVVQPGKLDNWTLELGPDMLRPFRCFRMESPARNVERKSLLVLFYGSDVIGSFGGSLDCFFLFYFLPFGWWVTLCFV